MNAAANGRFAHREKHQVSRILARNQCARAMHTRPRPYNLLCQLGTHPTYTGFQMLQSKGSNLVNVGPFFEASSLDAVLSELAKTIMQAGSETKSTMRNDNIESNHRTECHSVGISQ